MNPFSIVLWVFICAIEPESFSLFVALPSGLPMYLSLLLWSLFSKIPQKEQSIPAGHQAEQRVCKLDLFESQCMNPFSIVLWVFICATEPESISLFVALPSGLPMSLSLLLWSLFRNILQKEQSIPAGHQAEQRVCKLDLLESQCMNPFSIVLWVFICATELEVISLFVALPSGLPMSLSLLVVCL